MKKGIVLIMVMIFCISTALPIGATDSTSLPDGHFATAEALFQYWESTYPPQYPDYISGVWTDNGTAYPLTFAVTDDAAGREGKKEVLRLLADDDSVIFVEREFSRNLLWSAMEDLSQYLTQDLGLCGLGVYDMENRVGVEILQSYAKHEPTLELLREMRARYGDVFTVTYTDGYTTYTLDISDAHGKRGEMPWTWLGTLLGIGLLAATGAGAIGYRRHILVMQTPTGEVEAPAGAGKKLSCRQVKRVLKESEIAPDPGLEEKIRAKVDR